MAPHYISDEKAAEMRRRRSRRRSKARLEDVTGDTFVLMRLMKLRGFE